MKSLRTQTLPIAFVLLWAGSYVAGALATSEIAPLTVNLWRYVGAVIAFGVIAVLRRERLPHTRATALLAVGTGLAIFAVQFSGLYIGLAQGVPAATTALFACSAPLFVAAAAHRLGWERLRPRQWFGIALGVLGVGLTLCQRLAWPPHPASLLWTALGLAGMVIGSLGQSRLAIRARRESGQYALLFVQVAAAATALAVLAPLTGSLAVPLTSRAVWSMTWMIVVSAVLTPVLLATLIARRGASGGTSLLFVVPAITAVMAWPVLGQPFGLSAVAGFLVAGAGLLLLRGGATSTAPRPDAAATSADPAPRWRPWRRRPTHQAPVGNALGSDHDTAVHVRAA